MTYQNITSIPFWNEKQIRHRNYIIDKLYEVVSTTLKEMNKAWDFHQIEGSILTPHINLSGEYTSDEIVTTNINKADQEWYLRPETTPSSYQYLNSLNLNKKDYPICIWQHGKSFRMEKSDGASASKLRFNEFNQLEFQCVYHKNTGVNYLEKLIPFLIEEIKLLTNQNTRTINSERLPNYSMVTTDIECIWGGKWKEVASLSLRKDYDLDYINMELAFGLDRLIKIRYQ